MDNISSQRTIAPHTPDMEKEYCRLHALRRLLDQQKAWLADLERGVRLFMDSSVDMPLPPEKSTSPERDEAIALERELAEITHLLMPASIPRALRSQSRFV